MISRNMIIALAIGLILLSGCTNDKINTAGNSSITGDATSDIQDDSGKVIIYFFWGDGCPHCAHEKPFLEELETKYSELEVKKFETWKSEENAQLFQKMANAYGFQARGVPTTFIGDKYWEGFAERMVKEMEAQVKKCIREGCENPWFRLE